MQSARKVLVLPLESELSFSTGTFLNNDDVIKRKLQPWVSILDCRKTSKKNTRHYGRDYLHLDNRLSMSQTLQKSMPFLTSNDEKLLFFRLV